MQHLLKRIKKLEDDRDRVKHLFSLGHITLPQAKKRLISIQSSIAGILDKLPEYERQMYLIKKEMPDSL